MGGTAAHWDQAVEETVMTHQPKHRAQPLRIDVRVPLPAVPRGWSWRHPLRVALRGRAR